jgi:DNA-binding transcriptional LysR family regulator
MIPPSMKARKLYDEQFVFVQRKGHPRGTAPLDLDTYCALDHVLVSTTGGSFHGFMDQHLDELGRERRAAEATRAATARPSLPLPKPLLRHPSSAIYAPIPRIGTPMQRHARRFFVENASQLQAHCIECTPKLLCNKYGMSG